MSGQRLLIGAVTGTAFGCMLWASAAGGAPPSPPPRTAPEKTHLAIFDDLDFNVFSGQKWDQLSHSHSKDIAVHWPDGHVTHGIDVHIRDLKAMFVYAPDTNIKEHPVRIAAGDWTAGTGAMRGTFTKPMTMGNKTIQPTGKSFELQMATFGHWKNGVMDEEWLYWDNQTYMKQLGLAP